MPARGQRIDVTWAVFCDACSPEGEPPVRLNPKGEDLNAELTIAYRDTHNETFHGGERFAEASPRTSKYDVYCDDCGVGGEPLKLNSEPLLPKATIALRDTHNEVFHGEKKDIGPPAA